MGGLTSSDYFAWIIAVGTGGQIIKSSDAGESVKEMCMRWGHKLVFTYAYTPTSNRKDLGVLSVRNRSFSSNFSERRPYVYFSTLVRS